MAIPSLIRLRRGISTNWAIANSVLALGEVGVEIDTGKFKIGDGTTPWNSLLYINLYTSGTGLQLIGKTFSIDSTVVTLDGSQVLTNKNIDKSQITGLGANAGFVLTDGSGIISGAGSLAISKQFNLAIGVDSSYSLDTYAIFGYTITGIYGAKSSSGTITAAIKINGADVTGLSGISINSTPQNIIATANNIVLPGNIVTVNFSSNSSAYDLEFSLSATRAS